MLKINKHWFDKSQEVTHLSCPKNSCLFDRGQPDTIIIHYTAGRDGERSAKYLAGDNVKASAHIVLDRSGHIHQLVPFNTIAWHAGRSSYAGRSGFNQYAIGIEIDNAGILEPTGDKFKSWFGRAYSKEEVVKAKHRNENTERYWHTYTEQQIDLVVQICEQLMESYPTINTILGHEEISPGRKQDPGPAFPLDKLRSLLLDSREEDMPSVSEKTEAYVDVPMLNIREMPSVQSELVYAPLEKGTKLMIQSKHKNWYKVSAQIEGWVLGEYLTFVNKIS
ncbi:N-acetylmuramoyl-L-alanine amidase [Ancylomarina sp. DW003]|nr:N-acetylmuramoyl-L-alanine amidase [Ancylomarina sp. DW003]MDE5422438.1 N-acetylmuramoyl-L-alanine amidase [Ancylomarina sp. DW003]